MESAVEDDSVGLTLRFYTSCSRVRDTLLAMW